MELWILCLQGARQWLVAALGAKELAGVRQGLCKDALQCGSVWQSSSNGTVKENQGCLYEKDTVMSGVCCFLLYTFHFYAFFSNTPILDICPSLTIASLPPLLPVILLSLLPLLYI